MGVFDQLKKIQSGSDELAPKPAAPSAKSVIEELTSAPAGQVKAASADNTSGQLVVAAQSDPATTTKRGFQIRKVSPEQLALASQAPAAPSASVVPVNPQKATGSAVVSKKIDITADSVLNIELNTFERGTEKYTQEEVDALRGAINMLQDSISDAKIVGQAIKNVMFSLSENPELKTFMKPVDIGLMVRGLRESYGVSIAKRSEAQAKTNTRKNKQKDMDDAFADFEF